MSSRQKRREKRSHLHLVERPKAKVVRIDRKPRGLRRVRRSRRWSVTITTGLSYVTVGHMLREAAYTAQNLMQDAKVTPEAQANALRDLNAILDKWGEEPLIERIPDPMTYYTSPTLPLWPRPTTTLSAATDVSDTTIEVPVVPLQFSPHAFTFVTPPLTMEKWAEVDLGFTREEEDEMMARIARDAVDALRAAEEYLMFGCAQGWGWWKPVYPPDGPDLPREIAAAPIRGLLEGPKG